MTKPIGRSLRRSRHTMRPSSMRTCRRRATRCDGRGALRGPIMSASRALPLTGVKVLELGHIAAAPFASLLLADLGADVVKVESPAGDGMRQWPPVVEADGVEQSFNFASLNRNKR